MGIIGIALTQKQIQANAITCIREVPKAKDSFDGPFKYVNCSQ